MSVVLCNRAGRINKSMSVVDCVVLVFSEGRV